MTESEQKIAKGKAAYEKLLEITKEPYKHNEALLKNILKENAETEFGRRFNFNNIHSIDEYKKAVPLSDYDDYIKYITKMTEGELNQLTADEPICYMATSGTIGEPKKIPVTKKTLGITTDFVDPIQLYIKSLSKNKSESNSRELFIASYADVKAMRSGVPYGDFNSMLLLSLKSKYNDLCTTPMCSVFSNKSHDYLYCHARFALLERDLGSIIASFMTNVYELARYILLYKDLLINDIQNGTIDQSVSLPDDISGSLMEIIKPEPERAEELKLALSGDNHNGFLKRIWPKLYVISGIGSASFELYTKRVSYYSGNEVDFCFIGYGSSEGVMSVISSLNSTDGCLMPHSLFFEFIPEKDSYLENPETLTINQLETGKLYEVVITNMSGLYRYRIKDVVKVTSFLNDTPQVCFDYRINQIINMAGEKTTEPHLRCAVEKCFEFFGYTVTDYAAYADINGEKGHYTIFAEANNTDLLNKTDEISEVLHNALCEANPDILFAINEGVLGMTQVKFVKPNTFSKYDEMRKLKNNTVNRLKPVRLIDTPEKEEFFLSSIININ